MVVLVMCLETVHYFVHFETAFSLRWKKAFERSSDRERVLYQDLINSSAA